MQGTTQALSKTMLDTSPALSSYLWTAFISTEPDNAVLVCSSSDGGTNWSSNTATGHSSRTTPSLAFFNGQLYCAYVGASFDDFAVYVTSTADGVNWTAHTPTGHSSKAAPSLAAFNGQLYCAYVGADADDFNVYVTSTADGANWSAKTPTGQYSSVAPSLTIFNGQPYCAYVADDGTDNVYVTSYDPAAGWTNNTNTGQSSPFAPSLAGYGSRLYCAFVGTDADHPLVVCSTADGLNWSNYTATGQYSGIAPSLAAPPTPLYLRTVVDSSAMLNVGNANLTDISSGLVLSVRAANGGVDNTGNPMTEPGSWGVLSPPCAHVVTVNATIDATWHSGSNTVGSWSSSDLQNAFAFAAGAVMQKISEQHDANYQNYSYTLAFTGTEGGDICTDPQPIAGCYIPAAIDITAYNNAPENAGQTLAAVKLTYSTGDQSGVSPCGIIEALGNALEIIPDTSSLGAIVGTVTSLTCN